MTFRQIVDPEVVEEYEARGWWGAESLADRVAALARACPQNDAFVSRKHRLTWSGYGSASDRLAGVLMAAGIAAGDRVAVFLPDGPSVHVAFLAAEKAGVTVVGIGARSADNDLQYLTGRTRASALVSFSRHGERDMAQVFSALALRSSTLRHHIVVPAFEVDLDGAVCVDGDPLEPVSDLTEAIAARRLGPNDLFMINSTSGTTGRPKCVMHTQNRWMYFHRKAVEVGALGPDEVVLSALPAPFGFGLWTAHFTPALLGAPTITLDRFSADVALELIERERVTVLCCVSTQFIMMLGSPQIAKRDLSSLRIVFTGGEMVPYDRARAFEEITGACILQFFGSNETGLLSATCLAEPAERRLRTAGRIVPEMHVRLYGEGRDVTATGRGQPAGRGPATCVGYFDDPAANAALFTADGWMLMPDVCTLDRDGYLTVVGRTSDIIIRGGKNISAAEVENAVASHPAVALVGAVAAPDPVFGERVCVYVELRPGATLAMDELIDHLLATGVSKEILPEHLVVLAELPRSAGGKVARGDLREDLLRRLGRAGRRSDGSDRA